ncbi:prephenate dehydrogenase/arogenate dehydrogenase family protein [Halocatena halophila]|uniref:prephenate dehydrogenase/arogenate dehydrogenase family protein n=1 Tax=Halocatena halophila TaxID=2814576 RepID=UPI002ED0F513
MNALIVGAGEMGRWFGGSISASIAYADFDDDTAAAAVRETGGRVVSPATEETFDLVCLAVPMTEIGSAIERHAVRASKALVDVAGVMEPAVRTMRAVGPDRERLSLHPLFAGSHAPGRIAVVADRPGPITDMLRAELTEAGNELFETTPEEHDRAMTTVQARAHAAILAYGLASEPVREEFHTPISAELTALLERITDGTPRVYTDIQQAFDGADDIADAATRLARADDNAFETLYRNAR